MPHGCQRYECWSRSRPRRVEAPLNSISSLPPTEDTCVAKASPSNAPVEPCLRAGYETSTTISHFPPSPPCAGIPEDPHSANSFREPRVRQPATLLSSFFHVIQSILAYRKNYKCASCPICCQPMLLMAIGKCRDVVCWLCSLKMRVLQKNNACAFCKTELEYVLIAAVPEAFRRLQFASFAHTVNLKIAEQEAFASLANLDVLAENYDADRINTDYGLLYASKKVCSAVDALLQYNCWHPNCTRWLWKKRRFASFNASLEGWKDHMKKVHHLVPCNVCLNGRQVFLPEQLLFLPRDLNRHFRCGDQSEDIAILPHINCGACDSKLFDLDAYLQHIRDSHINCYICDRIATKMDPPGIPPAFRSFDSLNDHYDKYHFLCRTCDYVAFASEGELAVHMAQVHRMKLVDMGSASSRSAAFSTSSLPSTGYPLTPYAIVTDSFSSPPQHGHQQNARSSYRSRATPKNAKSQMKPLDTFVATEEVPQLSVTSPLNVTQSSQSVRDRPLYRRYEAQYLDVAGRVLGSLFSEFLISCSALKTHHRNGTSEDQRIGGTANSDAADGQHMPVFIGYQCLSAELAERVDLNWLSQRLSEEDVEFVSGKLRKDQILLPNARNDRVALFFAKGIEDFFAKDAERACRGCATWIAEVAFSSKSSANDLAKVFDQFYDTQKRYIQQGYGYQEPGEPPEWRETWRSLYPYVTPATELLYLIIYASDDPHRTRRVARQAIALMLRSVTRNEPIGHRNECQLGASGVSGSALDANFDNVGAPFNATPLSSFKVPKVANQHSRLAANSTTGAERAQASLGIARTSCPNVKIKQNDVASILRWHTLPTSNFEPLPIGRNVSLLVAMDSALSRFQQTFCFLTPIQSKPFKKRFTKELLTTSGRSAEKTSERLPMPSRQELNMLTNLMTDSTPDDISRNAVEKILTLRANYFLLTKKDPLPVQVARDWTHRCYSALASLKREELEFLKGYIDYSLELLPAAALDEDYPELPTEASPSSSSALRSCVSSYVNPKTATQSARSKYTEALDTRNNFKSSYLKSDVHFPSLEDASAVPSPASPKGAVGWKNKERRPQQPTCSAKDSRHIGNKKATNNVAEDVLLCNNAEKSPPTRSKITKRLRPLKRLDKASSSKITFGAPQTEQRRDIAWKGEPQQPNAKRCLARCAQCQAWNTEVLGMCENCAAPLTAPSKPNNCTKNDEFPSLF